MSTRQQIDIVLNSEARLAAITEYKREMAEARKVTQSVRDSMASLSSVMSVGGILASVGISAGSFAAAMGVAVDGATRLSDQVEQATGKADIAGESYQILARTLEDAGGSAEELVQTLILLRKAIGDALSDKSSAPAKALFELGLSAKELSKLPIEASLESIAKGLSRISNENLRASLAADILGKGFASINPLLSRLADTSLSGLRREVQATHGIISEDLLKAIDAAGDRTQAAENRMTSSLAEVTLQWKEAKAAVADYIAEVAKTAGENKEMLKVGGMGLVGVATAASVGGALANTSLATTTASAAGSAIMSAFRGDMMLSATLVWTKFSTAAVPAILSLGALAVAAGVAVAAMEAWRTSLSNEIDRKALVESDSDTKRKQYSDSLKNVRTSGQADFIAESAVRYAGSYRKRLLEAKQEQADAPGMADADAEVARLEGLVKGWELIARRAREQGAAIAAANQKLDEQKRLQEEQAAKDEVRRRAEREAADWLEKNRKAVNEANAVAARKLLSDDMQYLVLKYQVGDIEKQIAAKTDDSAQSEMERINLTKKLLGAKAELAQVVERIKSDEKKTADEIERQNKEAARKRALDIEDRNRSEMNKLSGLDAASQADFRTTKREKDEKHRASLISQAKVDEATAAELRNAGTPEDQNRAKEYEDRARKSRSDIAAYDAGTPTSMADNLQAQFTGMQDSLGTSSENAAKMISEPFAAGFASINQGIAENILQGKSWGESWRALQTSVATSFVQAGVNMTTQWLMQMSIMKIKELGLFSLFEAKKTGVQVAGGAARSAAAGTEEATKTTVAAAGSATRTTVATTEAGTVATTSGIAGVFRSIMELGPIAGPVVFATAIAGLVALVKSITSGFAVGGYTPDGPADKPVGSVHAGEWVAPQWMRKSPTFAPIIDSLERARKTGVLSPSFSSPVFPVPIASPATSAVSAIGERSAVPNVTVVNVSSERIATRIKRRSEARGDIVRIMREEFPALART
jgi:hypothetical protein